MKNTSIAIIGAGGLGREIRALLERTHVFAGYYDDSNSENDHFLDTIHAINENLPYAFLLGIGDPKIKKQIANRIIDKKVHFANLVSENSIVNNKFLAGEGIIVCDGVVATINCIFESHVLLNLNVTIGHDVTIGKFSSVMPGAHISGSVTIGESTLIGTGAVVLQGINIGSNVVVGAGAVVTKNVPDNTTVVGIPAKVLKSH